MARRSLIPLTLVALMAVTTPATASNGGVGADDPVEKKRPRGSAKPRLTAFSVEPGRAFHAGRAVRVRFRIKDRSRHVRVHLELRSSGGRVLRRISLGQRRSGRRQRVAIPAASFPQRDLRVQIGARDPAGRGLTRTRRVSKQRRLVVRAHRFPIDGPFSYSGPDGRFGAARPGRTHQGQDLPAPEGTPVVAPRGGTVQHIAYQAEGAGHYVVLRGAGEDRTYVFMHLVTGSIPVREGQRVRTGERLGSVGNTGRSFGAHLHFEIWVGGWYAGGRPIDPLPSLKRWDSWS